MSSNKISKPSRFAVTAAATLALAGCSPNSEPYAGVDAAASISTQAAKMTEAESTRVKTAAVTATVARPNTPDTKEPTLYQYRLQSLEHCLGQDVSKYRPLFWRTFHGLKGNGPGKRDRKKFQRGNRSVEVDLTHCSVSAQLGGKFACFDPGGSGAWQERCVGDCIMNDPKSDGIDLRPQKNPKLWKKLGQECENVFSSVLRQYGIDKPQ